MLGYIERVVPFDENPKNSKKSLYKIADPFLNFYFHFVVPNCSFIEIEQADTVIKKIKERFSDYVAWYWEKLCRNAVPFLQINGIKFNTASNYWGTPAKNTPIEIDVVAESFSRRCFECKMIDLMIKNGRQKIGCCSFLYGKV